MIRYRAQHFRRFDPHETMAMQIGERRFEAADDGAVYDETMICFEGSYDRSRDRIHIVELRDGDKFRDVCLTGDS